MKTLKKQLKIVALFFSALILLQGCTVYKSVPISIEQAVQNESKVRVKTNANEKFKFSRIGIEDGNYYGVKKSKGAIVKTPLDQNFINTINEKDKTVSTIATVGVSIVALFGILVGIYLIAGGGGGYDWTFNYPY